MSTKPPLFAAVRLRASTARPYFRSGFAAMTPVPVVGLGTMAVDRYWRVYYDPEKTEEWAEKAASVFAHEHGHLLRDHVGRADQYGASLDAEAWQWAIDAEVNDSDFGGDLVLPGDPIYPRSFGAEDGLIAEQYYQMLISAELVEITLVPDERTIAVGKQTWFVAVGSYANGTKRRLRDVNWACSDSNVCKLAQGVVAGLTEGQARITASVGALAGHAILNVVGEQTGEDRQQSSNGSKADGPEGKTEGGGGARTCAPQDAPEGHGGCGGGSGTDGIPRPWELPPDDKERPGLSEAEAQLVRRQVAQDILDHVKVAGTVPAGWKRWAQQTLEPPRVAWQQQLASTLRGQLSAAGTHDYSYARPSRRRVRGVVLPAMRARRPKVGVEIDTSGSMSDEDTADALSEIEGICRSHQAEVLVACVDAAVHTRQKVSSARNVTLAGGGGTDMGVGLAALDKAGVDVIVVLTDGHTGWPSTPTAARTIVCLIGERCNSKSSVPAWAKAIVRQEGR